MNCPVCESKMSTLLCSCGYDASKDYTKYPTFGPVGKVPSVSALRARRAPKDALRCEKCGGTDFMIRIPGNTRQCSNCGWRPDAAPQLECSCGNRYFTVRLQDQMLVCPLCASVKPLASLLPQAPQPPAVPVPKVLPLAPKNQVQITAIAAGKNHTIALYSDGTVGAIGDNISRQCNVSGWRNIMAIAAGPDFTVGLKKDGTVIATGNNSVGQCNVTKWTGITAISANSSYTIGLHKDGTLYSAGDVPGNLADFSNYSFTNIAAGPFFVAVLFPRGQVRITPSSSPLNNRVRTWSNITAIAAGTYDHLVGLNSRGVPAAAALNPHDKCSVGWHNIQAIAAGRNHTVGLRKDGTVAATGINTDKRCEVTTWRNIIAVAAGSYHTVGLRKDGTLVATGSNSLGQCDVDKLIKH
ncbi:MAG: hypothetical protein IKT90_00570 [Clostridia bacterium]|nr:hypothetical protein [Clostridia bacterium]